MFGSEISEAVEAKEDLFGDASSSKNTTTEDDFNPRDGQDSANANGDFGDFESAFGESTKTSNNGGDGFADFSSAFGSGGGAGASDTKEFAKSTSLDLMGGPGRASAAPVSGNHWENP